jgi:hypothetical protein
MKCGGAVSDQRGEQTQNDGLQLTIEETLTLQAVWSRAEQVDWAVYERLRLRVLAWRFAVSLGGVPVGRSERIPPVADNNTQH